MIIKRQKTRIIFNADVQRKWKVIYSYPDSLLVKFENLKEGLNVYVNEGFSKALLEKCHFNHRFWKSFHYQISKNQTLEVSFRKAKGIRGDIGLEWCKHKILLRKYFRSSGRKNWLFLPVSYTLYQKLYFEPTVEISSKFLEKGGIN